MNIYITRRVYIKLLYFLLFIVFLGCTNYKEEAPFFEELFLEYGGKYGDIYKVTEGGNDNYNIVKTEKGNVFKGSFTEYIVTKYGNIEKETKTFSSGKIKERKKRIGRYSPIWIPAYVMEIGDEFDDRNRVERIDKWETWEVLVINDIPTGAKVYYELSTGFYVGESAKGSKIVLVKTNANIPTID